ncbi:hypothetical protein E3N88_16585 [Mikania micrantha]|uniref:Uncharacterized protein n=1 Tax=Mikania micrantha TaxID=192012 RepID=A0A5N6P1W8_9ASTR|nr:hypothetical protein E3N88_16585 [Mikania micrantha]
MDSGLRSRKRKHSSSESDPFSGIFTRSRSQIYFHRHRSGYTRSDSNRSRNHIKSLKDTAKSLVKQESEDTVDQVTTQSSVIDLRTRRVFSPATIADDVASIGEVDSEAGYDVLKKNDEKHSDLRVFESVAIDMEANSENIVDTLLVGENNVIEADGVEQMTPAIAESEQNKGHEEKSEIISVANEIEDTKGLMIKNHNSVASLRGRKKVFKSPSSFSYRRLLPYLMDSGNDDSSSFELVEATLPKDLKSSNIDTNLVSLKDVDIGLVSNDSKLADDLSSNAKSSEKQLSNSVNDGIISTIEGSSVGQKSQEDALNAALVCEQMTPPDSDIHSKSKINNIRSVPEYPKLKPALKSCTSKKVLQTPTSFSHRRLLPYLMNVAGDHSCSSKCNQPVKSEKALEENQQPPTQSLLHQDKKSTTAEETSNSPTSTLIPVDTSIDITKSVTLVSNGKILDANGPDKEGSELISQLEVNLQDEAVKSDSCIKLEQSPPKIDLKCVEEASSKAITPCIEQSCSEDHQITVKESPHQQLLQIHETHGEDIKSGILKRTPRGCRGICNCLNCTSFRLHAERSFEFSKNQMHDAEEVALGLINDLTCLRNILETASSYSNSLDTVKEKQVKEACAKALYKEQVARARLAQMNEDLSIHCRSMNLLRPKVTFANKIEERVILKNEVYGRKRG